MNDNGASQSSVGLRKDHLHEEMCRGLRSMSWVLLKHQNQMKGLETWESGICVLRDQRTCEYVGKNTWVLVIKTVRTLYLGSQVENKTMLRSELPTVYLNREFLCVITIYVWRSLGVRMVIDLDWNISKRSDWVCMAKNEVRATNRVLVAIVEWPKNKQTKKKTDKNLSIYRISMFSQSC